MSTVASGRFFQTHNNPCIRPPWSALALIAFGNESGSESGSRSELSEADFAFKYNRKELQETGRIDKKFFMGGQRKAFF